MGILIEDVCIEFTNFVIPKGKKVKIVNDNKESDYICINSDGYNYMVARKSVKY